MAGLRLRRPWSSTAAVEWRGGPGAHVNLCMASAWPAVAYSGPAMHMHGAQRRSSYDGGTMVATVIGKRAREGRRELGKEEEGEGNQWHGMAGWWLEARERASVSRPWEHSSAAMAVHAPAE